MYAAIDAAMTYDGLIERPSPPVGERLEGTDAVRAAWEQLFAASPTAHFAGEEMFAVGDRCVVRWVYTWTDDGAEQRLRGVDVITVRDGLVAEKLAYVKG